MYHFVMDAFHGYRSRLDDIVLVHEILEEIPAKLGLKTVMPPFILPYYNGVIPEDCGISAFLFLAGGQFTIHTFSFREVYFVDLVSPHPFDGNALKNMIREAFPAQTVQTHLLEREKRETYPERITINSSEDFGPHVFLDFQNYQGPKTMDELFSVFDSMPFQIGMTPIIRPYIVKNPAGSENVISVLTMIAESHISLHYFPDSGRAYLDLFSCRFFDYNEVIGKLKQVFQGDLTNEVLISRGSKYHLNKNNPEDSAVNSRAWLDNVFQQTK